MPVRSLLVLMEHASLGGGWDSSPWSFVFNNLAHPYKFAHNLLLLNSSSGRIIEIKEQSWTHRVCCMVFLSVVLLCWEVMSRVYRRDLISQYFINISFEEEQ